MIDLFLKESSYLTKDSPCNRNDFSTMEIDFGMIADMADRFHYKGSHMGGSISFVLGLFYKGDLVGGAVVGPPRHQDRYENCAEIRRMVLIDECPRNSESLFLSRVINHIRKVMPNVTSVLSYSDLSVNHYGTIYKASNFVCIGKTAPSKHIFWNGKRYHPRSLTIERPYSYALRQAIQDGSATIEVGLPKNIFIYYMDKKTRENSRRMGK